MNQEEVELEVILVQVVPDKDLIQEMDLLMEEALELQALEELEEEGAV